MFKICLKLRLLGHFDFIEAFVTSEIRHFSEIVKAQIFIHRISETLGKGKHLGYSQETSM